MTDALPSLADLRATFIDALHFEGDQGLWEVVWSLNASHASAPVASKVTLARELIFDSLSEGVVTLSASEWPRTARDGRPLTATEMERLRVEDAPWFEPSSTPGLVVWVSERKSA
ncbi:MAG: hypothetical protein WDA60_12335 [Acidimicrobiia bacterium]|jgi:hypothetical protein